MLLELNKIFIILKEKSYAAKTNAKGVATVKINIKKKGTYNFTAKFKADKTFLSASKTGKLIIK